MIMGINVIFVCQVIQLINKTEYAKNNLFKIVIFSLIPKELRFAYNVKEDTKLKDISHVYQQLQQQQQQHLILHQTQPQIDRIIHKKLF